MTPLEQVLQARDTSFLQVYCERKGLVVVGVSLMDGDHEVVSFKKGSFAEALAALDVWLAGRLMEGAALAFWEQGETPPEGVFDPTGRSWNWDGTQWVLEGKEEGK